MSDHQPTGYFWTCPTCQTANPAGTSQCRACGSLNPTPPTPAAPMPQVSRAPAAATNLPEQTDTRSSERVRVFQGRTTDEAEASFRADAEQAKAEGFVAGSQRWDTTQPWLTLVAQYRKKPKRSRATDAVIVVLGSIAVVG